MLRDGTYVRMLVAPNTSMGTISGITIESGKTRFIFHHDPRFIDPIPDVYLFDFDVEECERPTDAEVQRINELVRRGTL